MKEYRDLVVKLIDKGQEEIISCEYFENKVFVEWYKLYSKKELRKIFTHPVILNELLTERK